MNNQFDSSNPRGHGDDDYCSAASLVEDAVYNSTSYRHLEDRDRGDDEPEEGEGNDFSELDDVGLSGVFKRRRRGRRARSME